MKTIQTFLFCLLAQGGIASAQSTGGSTTLIIKGASDSRLSLPYQQAHLDGGAISRVTSNSLVLQGKDWTPGQFTRIAGVGGRACYGLFIDGPLQGVFYKILSNNEDTLVFETEGDDLTDHSLGDIGFGDQLQIIPYWTIADVFGDTSSNVILEPRVSPLFPTDDILLYNNNRRGINKAPESTIYFRQNQGWRSVAAPSQSSAETILPPGSVFVVRRRAATDLALINYGVFYRQRHAVYVAGGETTGNDHYVSLLLPEPLTLNESNLADTVVSPTSSPMLRADEVLVWRSPAGFNSAPDTTLYYSPSLGWLKVGDNTDLGNTFTLAPGEAIIIRKKASSPAADWLQFPPE